MARLPRFPLTLPLRGLALAGLCALFAGFRLLRKRAGDFGSVSLLALAFCAGFATALIEAGYYAFATGADAMRVLAANLDFSYVVRPAWWVLGAGLAMIAIDTLRANGKRLGKTSAELGWILEDNKATNNIIRSVGGVHYKTHRIYEKVLAG